MVYMLTRERVRELYATHCTIIIMLFIFLVYLFEVPVADSKGHNTWYSYTPSINVLNLMFSSGAILTMQGRTSDLYIRVMIVFNAATALSNVVFLTMFSVAMASCQPTNTPEFLCNIPDNKKVDQGFIAIMSCFLLNNIYLCGCIWAHKRLNRQSGDDTFWRNPQTSIPRKFVHVIKYCEHGVTIFQILLNILMIEAIVITPYSRCVLIFLLHIPNVVPFFIYISSSSILDKKNEIIGLGTSMLATICSAVAVGLSAVYFEYNCNSNPPKSFIDSSCVTGFKPAIGYVVVHSLFLFSVSLRGILFGFSMILPNGRKHDDDYETEQIKPSKYNNYERPAT